MLSQRLQALVNVTHVLKPAQRENEADYLLFPQVTGCLLASQGGILTQHCKAADL